jgi:hypothetical protein
MWAADTGTANALQEMSGKFDKIWHNKWENI